MYYLLLKLNKDNFFLFFFYFGYVKYFQDFSACYQFWTDTSYLELVGPPPPKRKVGDPFFKAQWYLYVSPILKCWKFYLFSYDPQNK
jgi:hypothetical protein